MTKALPVRIGSISPEWRIPFVRPAAVRLWRAAISVRTAVALMLALGLLGLAGALIPQAPSDLSDPDAHRQWIMSVTPAYGPWTGLVDALGLFTVFNSVWFRLTIGALVVSILACSVNRLRALRRSAFHAPRIASSGFFETAAEAFQTRSELALEDARDKVVLALGKRHYRTVVTERQGEVHVLADRFRFGPFGSILAHLSLVTIMVGGLVGSMSGFRDAAFVVPVGSTVSVGHGTSLSVEAVDFTDSYYVDGSPSDYSTDVVLYDAGVPVAAQRVRVNEPLRAGDLSIYQSFFGPAVVMAAEVDGRQVYHGGVALVWASGDGLHDIGRFTLDPVGLTVYVGSTASGQVDPRLAAGQVQVEVYRTGDEATPIASAVLTQGVPAVVAGVSLTFERERQFSGLIVARDPGLRLIWLGAALLVAGLAIVLLFRPRRVWLRIRRSESGSHVAMAAAGSRDPEFHRQFESLATTIQDELQSRDRR